MFNSLHCRNILQLALFRILFQKIGSVFRKSKSADHKNQLARLQAKDPEFYKFLKENDKELLDFNDSDTGSEMDDNQDDNDDDDHDDDDDDDGDDDENKEEEGSEGDEPEKKV